MDWTFEQSLTFVGAIFSGATGLLVIWLNAKLNKNTVETLAVKETMGEVKVQVDGQMSALKLAVQAAYAEGAMAERTKNDAANAARNAGKLESLIQTAQPSPVQDVQVVNEPTDPVHVTQKK